MAEVKKSCTRGRIEILWDFRRAVAPQLISGRTLISGWIFVYFCVFVCDWLLGFYNYSRGLIIFIVFISLFVA